MGFPDWKILFSEDTGWAHLVCCPENEVDNFFLNAPSGSEAIIRFIRGERCNSRERIFQEWAAALQFPWYFGENWDAFFECIRDLKWLPPAKSYIFFVTQIDRVLPDSKEHFEILISVLKDAASDWRNPLRAADNIQWPATPFHIVFHCEPGNEKNAKNRLKQAGLDIRE
jgi:hypothetical protein